MAQQVNVAIRQMRILVVGGDINFFTGMQSFLQKAGFQEIQGAADIEAAQARASLMQQAGTPFDLLLLDFSRCAEEEDEGAGFLYDEVREIYEQHGLIVLASGCAPSRRLRQAGVRDFIGPDPLLDVRARNLTLARIEHELVRRLFARQQVALTERNRVVIVNILRVIVRALEAKYPFSHSHSENVARWARRVARRLGWSLAAQEELFRAAMLHDLGEIGIPEDILLKPGALTGAERTLVERHPLTAVAILEPIEDLRGITEMILTHHEHFDGGGYPRALRGEAIPLGGRILHVCEAYEAMISPRPYRTTPKTEREAAAELQQQAGRQFDPQAAAIFLEALEEEQQRRRRIFAQRSTPGSSDQVPTIPPEYDPDIGPPGRLS